MKIKQSKNADTRTCDVSKVSKIELLNASIQHIDDVRLGMLFFSDMMTSAGVKHDYTKLSEIDKFYADFQNNFKTQEWYNMHKKVERHHLSINGNIPDDVNLIDVLEFIVDGVMAGMARSGKYRQEDIPDDLLQKAFNNTIKLLLDNVEVVETKE